MENTRKNKFTSSCWANAVVLNEVFLAFGFFSRMIRCLPLDLRPSDCHCVMLSYSDDYRKWVVFDAAMGTYYTNSDKIPMSVQLESAVKIKEWEG